MKLNKERLIQVFDRNRPMCIEHFTKLSKEQRDLADLIASAFELEGWNLFAVTRKREVADARRFMAYILRKRKGYSLEHIGEIVSIISQDHTTVRTAVIEIGNLLEKEAYFKSKANYVFKSIEPSAFDNSPSVLAIAPPRLPAFQIASLRGKI